jgi:hypothetical protein
MGRSAPFPSSVVRLTRTLPVHENASRKSLLLFDTCDSGSLIGAVVAERGLERVVATDKLIRAVGRTVLTAATEDAPALEGYRGHGIFTYAVLDAFANADTNGDGLVDVSELAAFVDRAVPEISRVAFNRTQVPQFLLVGSNFAVAKRIAVLTPENGAASMPSAPTHVVIGTADLRKSQGGDLIATLAAGSLVRIVDTADGWALIARNGKPIGYVEAKFLARTQ